MLLAELIRSGQRSRLLRLLLIGTLQAVAAVAYVALVRHVFDSALEGPMAPESLAGLALGLLSAAVGGAWLRRAERAGAERLAHELVAELRADLFEHALELQPTELARTSRGGLLLRFTGDLEPLRRWFVLGVVRLPIAATVLLAALIALGATAPRLALLVGAIVVVGTVTALAIGRRLEHAVRDQRRLRSRLTTLVAERLDAAELVRTSGRAAREQRRIADQGRDLALAGARRATRAADLRFVAQATIAVSVVAALVFGLLEVSQGRATPGDVVASTTLLGLLSPPVRELARAFEARAAARVGEEKLRRFRALPVVERAADSGGAAFGPGRPSLTLDGLRVEQRELASACIAPGTLVVLRGPNGAGKSTWLEVIAGHRRPDAGEVRLGETPIADLRVGERRRRVGVATPNLPLISGSISKNVRYRLRRPKAAELREALEVSGLSETSIGTDLGRRVREFGRGLSDGERGRIGLARAVLGRPDLLVLDEVDAHLDERTAERLRAWIADYDGIVVAATHDPRLVAAADQVIDLAAPTPRAARVAGGAGLLLWVGVWSLWLGAASPSAFAQGTAAPAPPPASGELPFEPNDAELSAAVEERADDDQDDDDEQGLDPAVQDANPETGKPEPTKDSASGSFFGRLPLRHDGLLPELGALRFDRGDWSFRLNGRLHVDMADFDATGMAIDDAIDIRRGRLAFEARFDKKWRALVDYEYLGVFPGYRNTFLRYTEGDVRVTIGHQIPPFSLEEVTSSNEISLLERSLAQALTPGFQIGAAIQIGNDDGQVTAGIFGDPLDQAARTLADGRSFTVRATRPALHFGGSHPGQLHIGFAAEQRFYEEGQDVRFRTYPEARLSDERLLSTGRIEGVDSSLGAAAEFALDRGPYALQGEWIVRTLDGGSSPTFGGGYVQASTYLTGEHRRYSGRRGTVRPPRPERSSGAVELVARYSWLDLESSGVTGGEQENWSLGLNWLVGRNWRFSLGYVDARARPNFSGDPIDLQIVQGRVQFAF